MHGSNLTTSIALQREVANKKVEYEWGREHFSRAQRLDSKERCRALLEVTRKSKDNMMAGRASSPGMMFLRV